MSARKTGWKSVYVPDQQSSLVDRFDWELRALVNKYHALNPDFGIDDSYDWEDEDDVNTKPSDYCPVCHKGDVQSLRVANDGRILGATHKDGTVHRVEN